MNGISTIPPKILKSCGPLLLVLAVAGCSGDRISGFGPSAGPSPGPAALAKPPLNMAGRWTLAAPGGSQCAVTFGGAAGGSEGTIAPQGGCPGKFFTSRKWAYTSDGLAIRDHNGEPLAQLAAGADGFSGQSTGGEAITLSR